MSTLETPSKPEKLDEVIDTLLSRLLQTEPGTEIYTLMTKQLSDLYKTREIDAAFKLKEIESKLKQEEVFTTLGLKADEVAIKQAESTATLELKTREFDLKRDESIANAEARTIEIEIKHDESEANLRLKELEIQQKKTTIDKLFGVSPDTIALIGANLTGIGVIIGYERLNIITTKALGLIAKLR